MNSSSSSSGTSSTATTRDNAAPSGQRQHPKQADDLSEDQFLQQQAQQARDAISRTLSVLGADLGRAVDPRGWTRSHPWAMLASASVAGFIAAAAAIPSKDEQVLRKLKHLERALIPEASPPPAAPSADGHRAAEDPASQGIFHGLLNQVIKAVGPALVSAVTGGITAKAAQPDDGSQMASGGNGSSQGAADAAGSPSA